MRDTAREPAHDHEPTEHEQPAAAERRRDDSAMPVLNSATSISVNSDDRAEEVIVGSDDEARAAVDGGADLAARRCVRLIRLAHGVSESSTHDPSSN